MTFSETSCYAPAKTYRVGGCRSALTRTLLLLLSLWPSSSAAETERRDSLDELLSRWSAAAAGRQDSRDELPSRRSAAAAAADPQDPLDEMLWRWSAAANGRQDPPRDELPAAAGRQDPPRDERRSRLMDTYARGTSTAAAETPRALHRDRARSVVTVARNGRPDGAPCPTVEGLWLSTNLETAFDMRSTGLAGRLDVRAVGSDWTGGAESVFGDRGPVTAFVSQPSTGTAVTFVGHCRASHGLDTMTGVWVIASPAKNKLDHHLAVQPIPDTLHRLQVE